MQLFLFSAINPLPNFHLKFDINLESYFLALAVNSIRAEILILAIMLWNLNPQTLQHTSFNKLTAAE